MSGVTKMDLNRLQELHGKGLHPSDIAKELEYGVDAVIQQLHNLGLEWARKPGGHARMPEDTRVKIIDRYKAGEGATTIALDLSISKKSVYNVLNSEGVGTRSVESRRVIRKVPRNPRLTEIDSKIKDLHDEGLSPAQIAKQLNIYDATVRYSLTKQGLYTIGTPTRAVRQKQVKRSKGLGKGNAEVPKDFNLRHDAFEEFSEECYYWIGMMNADGCIHQPVYGQPILHLGLKRSDRYHIERLKAWIRSKNKIQDTSHFTFGEVHLMSSLSWSSTRMATALKSFGVIPHKQGRFVADSLRKSDAFWRGMVDGDGCVYLPGKGNIYLSGQPPIMEAWVQYIKDITGNSDPVRICQNPGVCVGSVRFKEDAALVMKRLYLGSSIHLTRKYDIAQQWFDL